MGLEDNNNFVEFITSFQKFLNQSEFNITNKDIENFFKAISIFDIEIEDKKGLADISLPIFCKNPYQFSIYKKLFIDFYDKNLIAKLDKEQEKRLKNLINQSQELNKKKSGLSEIEKQSLKNNGGSSKEFKYKASKELSRNINNKEAKELFEKFENTGLSKEEAQKLKDLLKEILKNSIKDTEFAKISKEINTINNILSEILKYKRPLSSNTLKKKIKTIENNQEKLQKQLEEELAKIQNNKETLKDNSLKHKDKFISNFSKTSSLYEGSTDFEEDFEFLSLEQKRNIKDFIRSQAIKFRTIASRDIRVRRSKRIDFKTTMKKATETNGIPLRISYEKPKLSKSNLVMFLDISGSCRHASELMLHFIYSIKEIFKGGVKCYVFVNSLVDISEFLQFSSSDESIQKIFEVVPTRGVYSDYFEPFRYFAENNMSKINKDTLVFFIGDARNNKNPIGAENIKKISRKAKKCFWLNTENEERWGYGDSVIYNYTPYMASISEVTNTKELISSLENIFK